MLKISQQRSFPGIFSLDQTPSLNLRKTRAQDTQAFNSSIQTLNPTEEVEKRDSLTERRTIQHFINFQRKLETGNWKCYVGQK
jgi:hypothetical protein